MKLKKKKLNINKLYNFAICITDRLSEKRIVRCGLNFAKTIESSCYALSIVLLYSSEAAEDCNPHNETL